MATDATGTTLPWINEIRDAFEPIDVVAFHERTLPGWLADRGHLVHDDLRGVASVAFRIVGDIGTPGVLYTWLADGQGHVRVERGDIDAGTLVEIDGATFSDFVHELLTASGAVRTGRARVIRGTLVGWQRWEPAVRALYENRPIYTPAVWDTLVNDDGHQLDLHRTFTVDDDDEEMRACYNATGYLHIRDVFTLEEIERYRAEVEVCRAHTTPGDPFSWWSETSTGREVVTRINYLDRFSPLLRTLAHDPRLARFARLAGDTMRVCDDRLDGPMVFIKNTDVVRGNGDLGWHVDDGIGGHPVMCPLIQAGIQLDHANPANGQLKVLAGSHRYAKHWVNWGEEGDLPVVALETRPGDLTVHNGDTMHTTPPPTAPDAGRRALYYKFAEPKTFAWVPAGCHYNDALFRRDDEGRVATHAKTWTSYA